MILYYSSEINSSILLGGTLIIFDRLFGKNCLCSCCLHEMCTLKASSILINGLTGTVFVHILCAQMCISETLLGTFQDETDEKVVYGLVHPLNTWNPIWVQVKDKYYKYITPHILQPTSPFYTLAIYMCVM